MRVASSSHLLQNKPQRGFSAPSNQLKYLKERFPLNRNTTQQNTQCLKDGVGGPVSICSGWLARGALRSQPAPSPGRRRSEEGMLLCRAACQPGSGLCAQIRLFCLKPMTPPQHPEEVSFQSFSILQGREPEGGRRNKSMANR